MSIKSLNWNNIQKLSILVLLILLGVSTKLYTGIGSGIIHNYVGGIIYVIFWNFLFIFLFPKYSPYKLLIWVFLVTSVIEIIQLIHIPLLEQFRKNFIFSVLFGNTFNLFDFIGYFIATCIVWLILYIRKRIRTK